jgi:hypothetical protein
MKVNGVEVVWPDYRRPAEHAADPETPVPARGPAPWGAGQTDVSTPCKRGHTQGRYRSGACKVCAKDAAREWYREKAKQRQVELA